MTPDQLESVSNFSWLFRDLHSSVTSDSRRSLGKCQKVAAHQAGRAHSPRSLAMALPRRAQTRKWRG
jgi:hypothetical protein